MLINRRQPEANISLKFVGGLTHLRLDTVMPSLAR
jgi:hypothetical protein